MNGRGEKRVLKRKIFLKMHTIKFSTQIKLSTTNRKAEVVKYCASTQSSVDVFAAGALRLRKQIGWVKVCGQFREALEHMF